MFTLFIDGHAGTTGLQIFQRLKDRPDLSIVQIPEADRKNIKIKQDIINSVDIAILCLPDDAARESVSLVKNQAVKILDASTAHRTHPNWVYGLPELEAEQREKIRATRFISVPGCYPTGFVTAIAPLVKAGIVRKDYPVTIQAVSGYSGGGRQMIEAYQNRESSNNFANIWSYRPYALHLNHKHLPEMKYYSGLEYNPLFVPAVAHIKQGMLVMIPFHRRLLNNVEPSTLAEVLQSHYAAERFIQVRAVNHVDELEEGFLSPTACNGTNKVDLMLYANDEQILLVARLDNLGKGASGAAVQNLNLMASVDETTWLN
jgi:N-acetyl-gamma-glutamyl-phosphate reductase